jgi:hypothetical protein
VVPVPSRSAFAGFRFPREVIVLAVRWYLRFGLSYRDVEELLCTIGDNPNGSQAWPRPSALPLSRRWAQAHHVPVGTARWRLGDPTETLMRSLRSPGRVRRPARRR